VDGAHGFEEEEEEEEEEANREVNDGEHERS
jgi:hypothetical protein